MLSRGISAITQLLVVKGYAAGPLYDSGGSGSNFLCLPEDPQWKTYIDGRQAAVGIISGVEYQLHNTGTYRNNIFSESNNDGNALFNNPAPCAVCYVVGRSTILMVPARTQCPDGWTAEYAGYLASAYRGRTESNYVCWDEAPEVAVGKTWQRRASINPVDVQCGTLPCTLYIEGRELTCVVCSR